MTTFEMQQLFETLLQTSNPSYNDADKPDTDTIFRYLNQAQVKYIKDKYLSAPSFYERTRILGNNLNDLKNLIFIDSLNEVTVTPDYPNSLIFKHATDSIWHYLSVSGKITRTYPAAVSNTLIDLMPIEAGDLNKYLTTAINKPIILVPVFTQTQGHVAGAIDNNETLLVIYDAYTTYETTGTKAHYLVYPKTLVLTDDLVDTTTQTDICQLADYLHEEIVELAVALFEEKKYKLISKEK